MSNRPRAIVVGSGAGGAAAARELQGSHDVTILEAGGRFQPLSLSARAMEGLRNTGLLLDPRMIGWIFPAMHVQRTTGGMFMVSGRAAGGTTTLATGNALRMDEAFRSLGINLDQEFEELAREVPASTAHQRTWTEPTKRLFAICTDLGLEPRPTPKMVDYARCRRCGRCILGCPYGAKWDSRRFLDQAVEKGARLLHGATVGSVVISAGKAIGVRARVGLRTELIPADLVVLCAGGLGTPAILERSGIATETRLFVDPVLCVAAPFPEARQQQETPMPFVVQRPDYIVSPYFDYLSFLFDRRWRHPKDGVLGLMIKLADAERGSVLARHGAINKALTAHDRETLREAEELCRDILARIGVKPESIFLGTLNAGHPGGMLPLTAADARTLHSSRLPPNLYVADATLFPRSLGNPPILTILALATRVATAAAERAAV
jgi:choline dehydrogenase-like flavoprotein